MFQRKYTDKSYIGKRYGLFTVENIECQQKYGRNRTVWKVKCDCGTEKTVLPYLLVSGNQKSCGCYRNDVSRGRHRKYEHSIYEYKRLYGIYTGIKKRCFNKKEPRYKDYGGRGITMCEEWANTIDGFDKFAEWALSHGYADDLTIERKDVNGNYCPENCKWITLQEQTLNTRNTVWVDYQGEHIQLFKLCERLGLKYDTIHGRIRDHGWSVERAVETPVDHGISFYEKCRQHGINPTTAHDRINKLGWSEERALNTPCLGRGANQKTYKVS